MPSFLTHPAVPLTMGLALGRKTAPPALVVAGVGASILPDLDMLTYIMGIPLSHEYGHRGFSHSILFAGLTAFLGAYLLRSYKIPWHVTTCFLFISTLSHGILDTFTNGGHGIAFLWPWSKTRYFSFYRVIEVSPIHFERMLPSRIKTVLLSELLWVWFPLIFIGISGRIARKQCSHFYAKSSLMYYEQENNDLNLGVYGDCHECLLTESEQNKINGQQ
ncbi:MAG: metal-dependent hydrolase [Desulfobacteraceae bacterium]|jgi:inner membrane protein